LAIVLGPEGAFRFARGEEAHALMGMWTQLIRRLDLADHSEKSRVRAHDRGGKSEALSIPQWHPSLPTRLPRNDLETALLSPLECVHPVDVGLQS
jgi:hypothetical protein